MAVAAVPAAISAVGSLFGGSQQRKWEAAQAEKQMAFQERMSSTAYQRAVADMKLAGINPMLAYMQGGAQSPGGAMAHTSDIVGPAVSSALGAVRLVKELQLMEAQKTATMQQGFRSAAEGMLIQDRLKYRAGDPLRTSLNTEYLRAQIAALQAQAAVNRTQLPGLEITKGRVGAWLNLLFGGLRSVK